MKREFRRGARIGTQNFASIAAFAPLVRPGSAGLPCYILAMNTAPLVGFFRYMLNRRRTTREVLK